MGEKETLIKEDIKYAGLVDFDALYKHVHDWLKDEDYAVTEKGYTEKVAGDSKELEIKWESEKKLTDYFKSKIDLSWRILNMKDVEVEIEGKKKKMNKATEVKIALKGVLESDYEGRWKGTGTYRFMKDVYHKYVIPTRHKQMKNKVENDVMDLKEEAKAFLELTARRGKSS